MKTLLTLFGAAFLLLSTLLQTSCKKEGCLSGEKNCRVENPCTRISFQCDNSAANGLSVSRITTSAERPLGLDALATPGDVILENGYVRVVIADIGHAHYLDPNGGNILDFAAKPSRQDEINSIFHAVGVLPRDAAKYTSLEIIDERPNRVSVQVKGTLDGVPDIPIYSRYELHPCDRGIRVRTEILNGTPETQLFSLVDGYYWSTRSQQPFAPGEGSGFQHKPFGLTTLNDVFRTFPYFSAASLSPDQVSYAAVSCTDKLMEGFHSAVVSAAGLPRQVINPRGHQAFERFIAAASSSSDADAIHWALDVRRQLFKEEFVKFSGKIERMNALRLDSARETSIVVSEGTIDLSIEKRTPLTHALVDASGKFSFDLPKGKNLVLEVHSFGKKQIERSIDKLSADFDVGTLTLPATGTVQFQVTDADTTAGINAEIFVIPADAATKMANTGDFHGQLTTCSPWLGPPPGASPACNRVLLKDGLGTAEVPVGNYYFYAFHGIDFTLGRVNQTVTPTTQTVVMSLKKLAILPPGTLSADLHVHGGASFDSSIPDADRVLSFAASNVDVIIATDHDVITDYKNAVLQLGLQNTIATVSGLETTGHIPFMKIPNYDFPLVIGHYIFWPLQYDRSLPRNGGPYDELLEPGELFDRMVPLYTGEPVIQLNHPWSDSEFGRDLGYPRALKLNLLKNLPTQDDKTSGGMYVRARGTAANNSHHLQEVMNGSQNDNILQHRAFWFYLMNQGQFKTGTANSDSHSLTDNTLGMPQNIVFTSSGKATQFNADAFNTSLKQGRSLGTNGPIITASLETTTGAVTPSLNLVKPSTSAKLTIQVDAAPWVQFNELRIVVNGVTVKAVSLPTTQDPLSATGTLRFSGSFLVSELLRDLSTDAWVVVEASNTLPLFADLGGGLNNAKDGIPDTGDNNQDGTVDKKDISKGENIGPLRWATLPTESNQPGYDFANITEGSPFAFTNPFILDLDGNNVFDAPFVANSGAAQ